jgi:DnaK suppressor protein
MSQFKLSARELEEFRELLLARRNLLLGDVKTLEHHAFQDGSELSTLPLHMADQGTDNFEQDITLGLMENERMELLEINEALERLHEGSYGFCDNCERPIAKERLRAIPYAKLCIDCKKKEEGL